MEGVEKRKVQELEGLLHDYMKSEISKGILYLLSTTFSIKDKLLAMTKMNTEYMKKKFANSAKLWTNPFLV